MPRMSGTNNSTRITMKPFCAGGTCDTVTISGDHNGNGLFDTDEPARAMSVSAAGFTDEKYWTFDGNPLVSSGSWNQSKFMYWTKFNGRMIRNDSGAAAGDGWGYFIWEDMKFSRTDQRLWAVTHAAEVTACIDASVSAYTFFIVDASGDLTFLRNEYSLACNSVFRLNNMGTSGHTITINDNEFFNTGGGMDLNTFSGGSNFIYSLQRNYLHDVSLNAFDKGVANATVADNIFACEGIWRVEADWSCRLAFRLGDDGCSDSVDSHDIVIERNRVYGRGESGNSNGNYNGGIHICGNMWAGGNPNITVRNNMLWHIRTFSGSSNCIDDSGSAAALWIVSPDVITVENNTIYDTRVGIVIGSANHTARNNISVLASSAASEFTDCSDAAGSYIFNNLHDTAGNVACENSSAGTCNGTQYSCAGIGGFGSSNKCVAPVFVKCDSATWCADSSATSEEQWDLHLHSTDTADKDAGTSGATNDFDQQGRPQGSATDIGADEFEVAGPAGPGKVIVVISEMLGDLYSILCWLISGQDCKGVNESCA